MTQEGADPSRARVALFGHWKGNIGHAVMAAGVAEIARAAFAEVETAGFEQHEPFQIYRPDHFLRRLPGMHHYQPNAFLRGFKQVLNHSAVSSLFWRSTSMKDFDLAIACGGPVLHPGVARGDVGLTYHHMLGAAQASGTPTLNLGIGSAFPIDGPLSFVSHSDRRFVVRMLRYSTVATCRDELAQLLCKELGFEMELLPDTAFVAGSTFDDLAERPSSDGYVVFNLQERGANTEWGQTIDLDRWHEEMRESVRRISEQHRVVFVCHDEREVNFVRTLSESPEIHRPLDIKSYAHVLSGAVVGVTTRIHAAIPLSSVGVPCLGIGMDTRLGTLERLGVRTALARDVDADLVTDAVAALLDSRDAERDRLLALRQWTLDRYVAIVREKALVR